MRLNRGAIFWGLALVTAGAVALAVQAGVVSRDQVAQAWRLWPVILIALGAALIASRTPFAVLGVLVAGLIAGTAGGAALTGAWGGFGCVGDSQAGQTFTRNGTFSESSAEVVLELSCGDLSVAIDQGSAWRLDARVGDGPDPRVTQDGASLTARSDGGGPFGVTRDRQRWDVALPSEVALDLRVDTNAGGATLDVGGGRFSALNVDLNAGDVSLDASGADVDELSVDANAASVSVVVDAETTLAGRLEVNAGSIELCAPDGTSLAITLPDGNVTFSHNLEDSGLERSGDTWHSPAGGPSGSASVDLSVGGNAGSFTYNPEGGCP
jgi:Domain of unknown function (DUF5668)